MAASQPPSPALRFRGKGLPSWQAPDARGILADRRGYCASVHGWWSARSWGAGASRHATHT